jgi:hypothetical protein
MPVTVGMSDTALLLLMAVRLPHHVLDSAIAAE